MNKTLTITASNRNRWQPGTDISDWFEKSIEAQTNKDFEVLIADGGSDNYEDLVRYCQERTGSIKFRIVQCKIGKPFERAKLNNVGIRNSRTPYILCSDVDMFFASNFVQTILDNVEPNVFLEARTMYWKPQLTSMIYDGTIDPINDLDSARRGRIKKRTSAGGCECTHIDSWSKVRAFDERYIGWGSEDQDLLIRVERAGIRVKWLCESREEIMIFHQHHAKDDVEYDLECQERNKKILEKLKRSTYFRVNPNGWGGKE